VIGKPGKRLIARLLMLRLGKPVDPPVFVSMKPNSRLRDIQRQHLDFVENEGDGIEGKLESPDVSEFRDLTGRIGWDHDVLRRHAEPREQGIGRVAGNLDRPPGRPAARPRNPSMIERSTAEGVTYGNT